MVQERVSIHYRLQGIWFLYLLEPLKILLNDFSFGPHVLKGRSINTINRQPYSRFGKVRQLLNE